MLKSSVTSPMKIDHRTGSTVLLSASMALVFYLACILKLIPPLASMIAGITVLLCVLAVRISLHHKPLNMKQDSVLLSFAALFIPLSIIVSPVPAHSMAAAGVLVLGIAAMYVTEMWLAYEAGTKRVVFFSVSLTLVFGLLGLLGMEHIGKFPILDFVVDYPVANVLPGIPETGFAANETGGLAAMLFPLLFVTTLMQHKLGIKPWLRAMLIVAFVLVLLVLLSSQSRGAMLAAALGLIVALAFSGKSARIVLGVFLAMVVAGIAFVGIDQLTGILSYHRRFDSIFPLLSGRIEIWERAWNLFTDLPLHGIGLDSINTVLPRVYPFGYIAKSAALEDAHNLPLQCFLDFGLVGGMLFLIFIAGLGIQIIRAYRASESRSIQRILIASIGGSFVAYLLFNTTDAVALSSPAMVVVFVFFALIRSSCLDTAGTNVHRFWLYAASGFVLASIIAGFAISPIADQLYKSKCIRNMINGEQSVSLSLHLDIQQSSSDLWYSSLVARKLQEREQFNEQWQALAVKAPRYIPFMENFETSDTSLAKQILHANPSSVDAMFWRARSVRYTNPAESVPLFRQGLSGDSLNGWAWLQYGDALLAIGDTAAAYGAFSKACYLDDPGLNGCWRAAQTAEALGFYSKAIHWYETSNFTGAKKEVSRLRKQRMRQQERERSE
jgi:O-antigen ligase